VLRRLRVELGAFVGVHYGTQLVIDRRASRFRVCDHRKVRLGQLGLERLVSLLPGVTVPVRQVLLEPGGLGVQEGDRPDGQLLFRDGAQRRAERARARERDEAMDLALEAPHTELDFGDEAGRALCVGDEGQEIVAAELLELARRCHHAGGDDVVFEGPVLIRSKAGTPLGQPARSRRTRVARRVHAEGESLLGNLAVDLLPDSPALGAHDQVVRIDGEHLLPAGHVDDDRAFGWQHSTIAAGRPSPRYERHALGLRQSDELDELLFRAWPNDGPRQPRGHERFDQARHRADVERVHLPLYAVRLHPVIATDLHK